MADDDRAPVPPNDRTLLSFVEVMWGRSPLPFYLAGVALIGVIVLRDGDAVLAWTISWTVGICAGLGLRYRRFRRTGE